MKICRSIVPQMQRRRRDRISLFS